MEKCKHIRIDKTLIETPTREDIINGFARPLFEYLLDNGYIKVSKPKPKWKEYWRVEIICPINLL